MELSLCQNTDDLIWFLSSLLTILFIVSFCVAVSFIFSERHVRVRYMSSPVCLSVVFRLSSVQSLNMLAQCGIQV